MNKIKGSRWVKVHKPGEANLEAKDNVMNITFESNNGCLAEITYQTAMVKSYKKAAYWLFKSLTNATRNLGVIQKAADIIQVKIEDVAEDTPEFMVEGENWSCAIEKTSNGVYKARVRWAFEEDRV